MYRGSYFETVPQNSKTICIFKNLAGTLEMLYVSRVLSLLILHKNHVILLINHFEAC